MCPKRGRLTVSFVNGPVYFSAFFGAHLAVGHPKSTKKNQVVAYLSQSSDALLRLEVVCIEYPESCNF